MNQPLETARGDGVAGAAPSAEELEVLRSLRELRYGAVEAVVHDGRIMEIRQVRRTRCAAARRPGDSAI